VWRHAATQGWVEQARRGALCSLDFQWVGGGAEEQRSAVHAGRHGEAIGGGLLEKYPLGQLAGGLPYRMLRLERGKGCKALPITSATLRCVLPRKG